MLAMGAAVVFGLALLFDWAEVSSDAFDTGTLTTIGLLLVALHLAGIGGGVNWRGWGGRYRRRPARAGGWGRRR